MPLVLPPLRSSTGGHRCHKRSENDGSERTTIICSNNGVEHQNNACMKGLDLSYCSVCHRQNGHRKQVWQQGAWGERLTPLIPTVSLASSGPARNSERIITDLSLLQ